MTISQQLQFAGQPVTDILFVYSLIYSFLQAQVISCLEGKIKRVSAECKSVLTKKEEQSADSFKVILTINLVFCFCLCQLNIHI